MVIPQTELTASLEGREIYRAVLPPGEYVIGREQDAQIRLHSDKISRRHGQLTLSYFGILTLQPPVDGGDTTEVLLHS
jgi:hypothetical protein